MGFFNFLKRKPRFKVGDIVKCIDDRNWNDNGSSILFRLRYGNTYKVLDVIKQKCCGNYFINTGGLAANQEDYTVCKCGREVPGKGIHWALEYRFELMEYKNNEEIHQAIKEAIINEEYEKASLLRDLILKNESKNR